ncbi:MAG: sigma-54-dependent Fis family transcriptional regulator [Bacteroidia bacterium]|nr:sigma-54-dependent Fis family transcriptional regulator [Bacteroidota bacterium]MBL7949859.1 sigma-54-dependent Fis family transcriptional regulator [Bacteroidia bacterium]MBP6010444.1 sigma-54-dependent Fis family transcriptional regulator [Bacteroidia bacterium]MBP7268993.1 sigma-54-dependent Fis family transcriptional regulator [Bacteroidia bacterium]MBP7437820.1 sigma-54-dependent Fis family transcriptional regulator [Bacteroidia bacterium]
MTRIFVVEDDQFIGNLIKKALEKMDNVDVTHFLTPEECLQQLHLNPDIVTIDYLLPGMNGLELMAKIKNYNADIHCIMVSGQDKLDVVIETYRQGAVDYIIKNDNAIVNLENSVRNLVKTVGLRQENESLKDLVIDRNKYNTILGNSGSVMRVLRLIQKVEKSNIMVLVTGQSGTGKELVAKSIHYNSPRARKPFVTVNMGAIPADLIESELFGHEKGAFTDARERRIGKFEEANEGTIFLDEIGEMDLLMQTKLLRVLQEKEVTRIGSNKSIKLDVRVVAATNRNLAHEVKEGKFREDLYYRLQGFLIHLPPLLERGDDVVLLSKTFLNDFCKDNKLGPITLTKEAAKVLMEYKWPGNIRELKAVIERAAIMSENATIQPEDLIFAQ